MKRLLISLLLLASFFIGEAQGTFAGRGANLSQYLILRGKRIDTISIDGTFGAQSDDVIPTQLAIIKYIHQYRDTLFVTYPILANALGDTISMANAAADGVTIGVATFNANDFNDNGAALISIDYVNGQKATTTQPGFLSTTDYNTFANKLGNNLLATHIFVGNANNIATDVAVTGSVSMSVLGVATVSVAPAVSLTGVLGASNGGTGLSTYTTGDIIYWNGTVFVKLPIGTARQTLHSTGSLPVWVDTSVSGGSSFTLTNGQGTTANGTTLDLGGTMSALRTIDEGSTGVLTITTANTAALGALIVNGTNAGNNGSVVVVNQAGNSGAAITANASGTGGTGLSSTGALYGVYGNSTAVNGTGVQAISTLGTPLKATIVPASATAVANAFTIFVSPSSGTPTIGYGVSTIYSLVDASSISRNVVRESVITTNVTAGSVATDFEIALMNAGTLPAVGSGKFRLISTGQIKASAYTGSGSFAGTPTGCLAFDASGNIITTTCGAGALTNGSGTTASGTHVDLGGTMTTPATITQGSNAIVFNSSQVLAYQMSLTGGVFTKGINISEGGIGINVASTSSGDAGVFTASSGNGITATTTIGNGVVGNVTSSGYAIVGNNTSASSGGAGFFSSNVNAPVVNIVGTSGSGGALILSLSNNFSSGVTPAISTVFGVTGTAAIGEGTGESWALQDNTAANRSALNTFVVATNVSSGSFTTDYQIWLSNAGTIADQFIFKGNGVLQLTTSPSNFANNAAAIAGGLTAGMIYRNGDVLMIVH